MKQYTDITVLLDRSGSMALIKDAMESAFNEFILKHREVPSTRLTLIQFDNENDHQVVYQNVPVASVERLNLVPRGSTPLVDAFVKAIDRTGERLASMRESERPDQVMMVVITDGEENASRNYKRADVALRVNKQKDAYNWNFIYLGANQDAIREANTFGIGQDFAITYRPSLTGTASMGQAMASSSFNYVSNTMRGLTRSAAFTDDDRKKAIDDSVSEK